MWHEGVVDGYRYFAKVYDTGSKFGINAGRVSKLEIREDKNNGITVYNYDRGLDFDKAPAGLVEKILALYPEEAK
jgi:hypothetical protein